MCIAICDDTFNSNAESTSAFESGLITRCVGNDRYFIRLNRCCVADGDASMTGSPSLSRASGWSQFAGLVVKFWCKSVGREMSPGQSMNSGGSISDGGVINILNYLDLTPKQNEHWGNQLFFYLPMHVFCTAGSDHVPSAWHVLELTPLNWNPQSHS